MKYQRKKYRHEDNLKVQLNYYCHKNGIFLEMEYSYKKCRFDAVLVRSGEILAIIEFKNWENIGRAREETRETPKQFTKYLAFGLPVLVVWKIGGLKPLYLRLKSMVNCYDGDGAIEKSKLVYFPPIKPKKEKQVRQEELEKLIKQQSHDIKYNFVCY